MLCIFNMFFIWFCWLMIPIFYCKKITINLVSYYPYVICPAEVNKQVKGIDIKIMTKIFSLINWKESIDYEFNCMSDNKAIIGENQGYLFINNLNESMFFKSAFVSQPFNFHGLYCLKFDRFKNVFTYANSYYFFIFLGVMPMLIGFLNKLILPNSLITEIIWNAYTLLFYVKDNFLAKKKYLIFILQSFLVFFTISIYISILTLNKLEKRETFDDMVLYYNGSDNNYVSSNKIHSIFFLNTNQTVEEIYDEMKGKSEYHIFIMDSVKAEILTKMYAEIRLIKKYDFLFTHNLLFNNSVDPNVFSKLDKAIMKMLRENVNYQETFNFLKEIVINEEDLSNYDRNDNDLEFFEIYLYAYVFIIFILFCFECLHKIFCKKYTIIQDLNNYTNPFFIRKSKNNELKTKLTQFFIKITNQSTFYLKEIIPFFIYRFKKTDKYKNNHKDTLTHHHYKVLKSIDFLLLNKAKKYIKDLEDKGYFKNERNRKRFEKKRRFINENLIKKFKNNLMVSFANNSKPKAPQKFKKTLFQIIISNLEKVDKHKYYRRDSSSPKKLESFEKVANKTLEKNELINLKIGKPKRYKGSKRINRKKKYEISITPKHAVMEENLAPISEKTIGFTFNVPYIAQIKEKPEFQSGSKKRKKFFEDN